MRAFIIAALLAGAAISCGSDSGTATAGAGGTGGTTNSCASDNDCKGDRICVNGSCTSPGTGGGSGTGGGGTGGGATGGVGGSGAVSGSGGSSGGNVPCSGCAGDPCQQNTDCVSGFVCARLNSTTAWCTNCNALGSCASACTADVNCGTDGVCDQNGKCWHGCTTSADCPAGYECGSAGGKSFCAPSNLPALDQECINASAGWCTSYIQGIGVCVYTGSSVQNPGENWCTKYCTTNTDCTDVWPLGCCKPLQNGFSACFRPSYCP